MKGFLKVKFPKLHSKIKVNKMYFDNFVYLFLPKN